jgi:hypothetical protein
MAFPLLAALAMLGTGVYQQNLAAKKANNNRRNVVTAEIERQKKYQGEAQGIFDKSLDKSGRETVDKQIEDAQADRVQTYNQITEDAPALLTQLQPGAMGDNQVIADEAGRQMTAANAYADQQMQAKALLSAFGDSMFQGNVDRSRGNQNLSMVGNLARGSNDVLPYEEYAAANSENGRKLFGSLLTQLGTMALGVGAASGARACSHYRSASAMRAEVMNAANIRSSLS